MNSIGDITYDMGLNTFISGGDMQLLIGEGLPIDPASSPITLNPYQLNLISYLPSDCIPTDQVFESIVDDKAVEFIKKGLASPNKK